MYLCAQPKSRPGRVHGHIAAAYHGYLLAIHNGRVIIIPKCLHQVIPGQIFIGGKYAVGIFPGNPHELGEACAGADEDGLKAFFVQKLVDGHRFPDNHVRLNLNPQLLDILHLMAHHACFRQTEFRDAVG